MRYNTCMDSSGATPEPLPSPSTPSNPPTKPPSKWYYNVWFVLLMLLFVAGPLGLPLVWKNPRFSRGVKIGLTLLMVFYTLLLIEMTVRMVRAVMEGVQQFNSTLQF